MMFEQIFKEQLATLTKDLPLIEKLWSEIQHQYSKPERHYHNLSHLNALVASLSNVFDKINNWQSLMMAVAYHDIVYNVLKNNNEEQSAKLAAERLEQLGLPQNSIAHCCAQIIATKGHIESNNQDTNYFIDADLAIFGSTPEAYKHYTHLIRKEYRYYPDLIYKPGRRKVLQHFVAMPRIYKTDYFYERFEYQARINLHHELKSLS
ncbi:HD domain-containing protein [Runella zeae]|uniref:HD domain-containing protein n=1 Tax=Runella zeae TaxID=94255 RepID=UPI00048F5ADF|nr:hypothetical protein [Runella zeae]